MAQQEHGSLVERESPMHPSEQRNIDVVLRYFDGCNTGELGDLLPTLADDVVHYFLPTSFPTIRGAQHLARFWAKYQRTLDPTWRIDQIIAAGDVVASEWSCRWRRSPAEDWTMSRGTEWYVIRNGLITEVRAYFAVDGTAENELPDFPYAERGYLPHA